MSDEASPKEFRDFLAKSIDSVGTLEVLLFFYTRQSHSWTADDANRELRSNSGHVLQQLEKLTNGGFLKNIEKTRFIYDPATVEVDSFVRSLSEMYATKRVSLITMIYESRNQDGIRLFSDAFKIRKD